MRYALVSEVFVDEHTYLCYDVADDEHLIDDVARIVVENYVDPDALLASLTSAAADLDLVASPEELSTLISEVRSEVIPQMDLNADKPHLQIPRNEVAELLAFDAIQKLHNAVVPASRVREKEVPGQPTRGLDILGLLEAPKMRAVFCEVKASSSSASPPAVVGSGADSMHAQLLDRIGNRRKLLEELNWAHKHAAPSMKKTVATAMIFLTRSDAEPPVAAPVLVRPEEKHGPDDFGRFHENPAQYSPAEVRFLILRIPGTLEDFANRVYARAREIA